MLDKHIIVHAGKLGMVMEENLISHHCQANGLVSSVRIVPETIGIATTLHFFCENAEKHSDRDSQKSFVCEAEQCKVVAGQENRLSQKKNSLFGLNN